MSGLLKAAREFVRFEDGPTVTEYAVLLGLIIVVAITGITLVGTHVADMFTSMNGHLPNGENP